MSLANRRSKIRPQLSILVLGVLTFAGGMYFARTIGASGPVSKGPPPAEGKVTRLPMKEVPAPVLESQPELKKLLEASSKCAPFKKDQKCVCTFFSSTSPWVIVDLRRTVGSFKSGIYFSDEKGLTHHDHFDSKLFKRGCEDENEVAYFSLFITDAKVVTEVDYHYQHGMEMGDYRFKPEGQTLKQIDKKYRDFNH